MNRRDRIKLLFDLCPHAFLSADEIKKICGFWTLPLFALGELESEGYIAAFRMDDDTYLRAHKFGKVGYVDPQHTGRLRSKTIYPSGL